MKERNAATAEEFSRQAEPMARARAFRSPDVLDRILGALGPPPLGRALDLACGPGIVTRALAPLCSEVLGVDLTVRMVELAVAEARRGGLTNARFSVASAHALPFATGSFDVVVTRLSLHHLDALASALGEVRRVLVADGRLLVADIVSSPDPGEALLHNALERLRDPSHVRMLTVSEMGERLQGAGLLPLHEETWTQERDFAEWAEVVAAPARTEPLLVVMRALAQAGFGAGIGLEETEDGLRFQHTWHLVLARPQ